MHMNEITRTNVGADYAHERINPTLCRGRFIAPTAALSAPRGITRSASPVTLSRREGSLTGINMKDCTSETGNPVTLGNEMLRCAQHDSISPEVPPPVTLSRREGSLTHAAPSPPLLPALAPTVFGGLFFG
jgi:hypothetical protein